MKSFRLRLPLAASIFFCLVACGVEPRATDQSASSLSAKLDAPSTETEGTGPSPGGATALACTGIWGQPDPVVPAGVSITSVEEVSTTSAGGVDYVLEVEHRKATVGPPFSLAFISKGSAGSACPGRLPVGDGAPGTTGNLQVGLAISNLTAAVFIHATQNNGGAFESLWQIDLPAGTQRKVAIGRPSAARFGVNLCVSHTGPKLLGLPSLEVTADGDDLELVGTGCASGFVSTGDMVRVTYGGFFAGVLSLEADIVERFSSEAL